MNQVYDLRQLMQRVNKQGEAKLVHIKSKNVSNTHTRLIFDLDLAQSLEASFVGSVGDKQRQCSTLQQPVFLLELEYQLLLWFQVQRFQRL